jgi:hypothetical protein
LEIILTFSPIISKIWEFFENISILILRIILGIKWGFLTKNGNFLKNILKKLEY